MVSVAFLGKGIRLDGISQVAGLGMLLLSFATVAGMPAVAWFLAQPVAAPLPWLVLLICCVSAGILLLIGQRWGADYSARLADMLARVPSVIWWPLMVGLGLRWMVLVFLNPLPASDGATYLHLAAQLVTEGRYGDPGSRATWPPGFPLLLAPWISIGVPQKWIFAIFNGLMFIAMLLGVRTLLRFLGRSQMQGAVSWGISVWPTLVLCSALPEKELVVAAALVWMIFGLLKGNLGSRGWILISGALMGVSILVQPSMQLLPAFIAVGAFVNGVDINKFIKNGFLFLLAMGFMITPWTIRNLNVFGEPLLVSSNGGDVLYRANNELATGVYIEKGQIDLRDMPELDRGREGQRLAKEWALAHPQDFVQLSASKIMHFMGDDAYGVYAVFKRGGVGLERNAYLFVRQVSAMPWLIIWVCMSIWLVGRRSGKGIGLDPGQALVMAPILYLSIIHSIFESGPKYHMPWCLWFWW